MAAAGRASAGNTDLDFDSNTLSDVRAMITVNALASTIHAVAGNIGSVEIFTAEQIAAAEEASKSSTAP